MKKSSKKHLSAGGAEQTVREFWRLMGTNDFYSVKAVLAQNFTLDWPQTGEHIDTADDFCGLNATYPAAGPWRFSLIRIVAGGGEAVSDVAVTDGVIHARAITFFTIAAGKIEKIVEFWPEPAEPPYDRSRWTKNLGIEKPG